jgi:hypothetical protein
MQETADSGRNKKDTIARFAIPFFIDKYYNKLKMVKEGAHVTHSAIYTLVDGRSNVREKLYT